jgi:hypothetical protein
VFDGKEQSLIIVRNIILFQCCERPFAACAAHPECSHLDGDCW